MATVHRFFVAQPLSGGDVALAPEIAHQLSAVLRLRPGDPLMLFDGSGGEWQAELIGIGREGATARLLRHEHLLREADLEVTLCPVLLKADKLEWVLQKGTELGAVAFQPLVTRRTVPGGRVEMGASYGRASALQADPSAAGPARPAGPGTRIARWRRIVVEAAEQSGRCVVPRIAEPLPLPAVLQDSAATVFLWEGERVVPFSSALAAAVAAGRGQVRLLVGPEGGFDPQEAELVIAAGARPASLGPRLLRSETAALAALSLALIPGTLSPDTRGPS